MAALAENSGATKIDIENDIPSGRYFVNILGKTESDANNEQRRFEEAYKKQFGRKPSYSLGYLRTSIDGLGSRKPESFGGRRLEDYGISKPQLTRDHVPSRFQYPRAEEMTIGEVYELSEHDDTFRLPEDLLR